ncbi:MAG TPA: immunoglobulin domain-containing protein [Opitutaceae bacterium]|nr:immunoglobulin domain-containing protein [Opitutaceae bacterium]
MNSIRIRRTLLALGASVLLSGAALAQGHYYSVIHQFAGGATDGANPQGSLTLSGSTLYGMTRSGGGAGLGTIFKLNTDGSGFTLLHSFGGGTTDGSSPAGSLLLSGSTLFGMTHDGGAYGLGTVFSVNSDGSGFALLHSFASGTSDGANPYGALVLSGSTLYGLTYGGGYGYGTVFKLNTDGTGFTVLRAFDSFNDGGKPYGSLLLSGSTLYGMTSGGGDIGAENHDASLGISGNAYGDAGTVFQINTDGSGFRVVFYFNLNAASNQSGYGPHGSLALRSGSTLAGLTGQGGPQPTGLASNGAGTMFTIKTDGTNFQVGHSFGGILGGSPAVYDGANPNGSLSRSGYGTTAGGGTAAKGTIFGGDGTQLLYTFSGGADGGGPGGDVVESGSVLYGLTASGGANGVGVVFALTPNGPQVTTQPVSQTAINGSTASFTVAASGSAVTYQWQRLPAGGSTWVSLADGGSYSGTATGTLTINPTTGAMDGDSFRCVVTNASGQDTSTAVVLSISNSVAITAPPANVTVAAGSSASFSVTAVGFGTIAYQWQRQAAGTAAWANVSDGGAYGGSRTATLTVTPVTAAMSGDNFQCLVSNANGSATSAAAILVVSNAVTITTPPSNQTATAGGNATFTVTASGVPTLTYQWQRQAAGTAAPVNLTDGAVYSGSGTATLTVKAVTFAMNGDMFQCVVSNAYGNAASSPGVLTVPVPLAIGTLAGQAGAGGGSDGTGTAAQFSGPADVAVDSSGNVYVADTNNDTIRKVTPAGVVTTVAGTAGSAGSADGTGAAARFNRPAGVAVDSAGNLYVADTNNNTVRKITPAGVVTTLAGQAGASGSADGTGSAARFKGPSGLAVDTSNNLWVADTLNHTLRKVTSVTGVVTTGAGTAGVAGAVDGTGAAARFFGPQGLAADASGNLFVADTNNHTIRQVVLATGAVTTLAGAAGVAGSADGANSAARFFYPSGVTVDGAGNLYVADTDNDLVREIATAGGVSTLAGQAGAAGTADGFGSAARFNFPSGIAADNSGNIYVADTNNQTIRVGYFPAPPAITTQPLSQSAAMGSSAKMTVTTSGRPTPSYQWYLNGTAIGGATGSSLTLASVAAADAGAYTVTATNSLGSATSNPANLSVYAVPTAPTASGGGGGAMAGWFVGALALLGLARRAADRREA